MKINRVAIAVAIMLIFYGIPVLSGQALAYDPRAEVPGATITGIILDANGNNIPNATVRLYLDGQLFDIPRNPQQSSKVGDLYSSNGRYQFMRLPYGQYLVVAEIPDASGTVHRSNLTVNVNANTMTADIVISDLVCAPAGISSTSPSPTAASSPPHTSLCGAALVLPLLGTGILMIYKKKKL